MADAPRRPTVFYASREPTRSPLAPRLLEIAARCAREASGVAGATAVSVRQADRMLTLPHGMAPADLRPEDLVEVVDGDPSRGTLLVVGLREPNGHAMVHWLVLRMRPEIGAVAQVPLPAPGEGPSAPPRAGPAPMGSLELAEAVLAALRRGPVVHCEGHGWLAVGRDLDEADARLAKAARTGRAGAPNDDDP